MSALLAAAATVLGAATIVVVLTDMGQTVISVAGRRGWLTWRLSRAIWDLLLGAHRRVGRPRLLAAGGPLILATIVVSWLVLLTLGWSLVFGSGESVIELEGGEPTALSGRAYYASSLMLGRGTPGYAPASDLWQAVEQVAAFTGLVLLGLAIAYILPVVGAVIAKRRTAAYASTLGYTAEEVIDRFWNGRDFGDFHLHLIELAPRITELAEQYNAYPVLHYFHSSERHSAIGPAVATIDETLNVLDCLEPDRRLEASTLLPLRAAIGDYLDTLVPGYTVAAEHALVRPPVDQMREDGLPLVDTDEIELTYRGLERRRRRLHALVQHHGWDADRVLTTPRWPRDR